MSLSDVQFPKGLHGSINFLVYIGSVNMCPVINYAAVFLFVSSQ